MSTCVWTQQLDGGPELQLYALPILQDNYCYVFVWADHAVVIDPGEAGPVKDFLEEKGISEVAALMNTHHHEDHCRGNKALKKSYDCPIIGADDDRIPGIEQKVREEELLFDPLSIKVLFTPGHTSTHVCFYVNNFGLLFTGDTLFGGGCGRLFEGTPQEIFSSLQKIQTLPDETLLFFGHEYTLKNLEFAITLEPNNEALKERLAHVQQLREKGAPTVPGTLGEEKKTNPFLRTHLKAIQEVVHLSGAPEVEVFARLREMRNDF